MQRELEKIKRERAEKRQAAEREEAAQEETERERDVAGGNPLLNQGPKDFGVKRRWDDDVVFRNQARGTDQKGKKEFVNVSLVEDVIWHLCDDLLTLLPGFAPLRLS